MSDPDWLAEIRSWRLLVRPFPAPEERIWVDTPVQDLDWLIGEVQDRRTDLAVALSQLQDALGEVARLRALLEPSVMMTSPPIYDPGNANEPPHPEGQSGS